MPGLHNRKTLLLVLIAGAGAGPAADVLGQETPAVQMAATDYAETIDVYVGKSAAVETPWMVSEASITDPDIADVQVLGPRRLLVMGNEIGSTDLVLRHDEEASWHARINVIVDLTYIQEELDKLFPNCRLNVVQSRDMLVVKGFLRRAEQAPQLRSVLDGYGVNYIDATSLAGVQQVLIQVRVAEVSRAAIKALGTNALIGDERFFGASTIGSASGGALNPISIGPTTGASAAGNLPFEFIDDVGVSQAITLFGGFPNSDLEFFLQALAENQYLRILAEPTLVAMSGEQASFLAGGEFPVPVVQAATAGSSSITVEYREFGVRLNFRPFVLGDGTIRMYVAPEVSDITDVGAVEIEGFRIPAVISRRAETTLEVNSGQTFAIAGLLQESVTARASRVPLLGDLPILGALFRSVRYERNETELVVLVTASLAEPMSTLARPVPGDEYTAPTDWELYVDGVIEGEPTGPVPLDPADAEWLRETGLHRLQGPGAWADYERRLPTATHTGAAK